MWYFQGILRGHLINPEGPLYSLVQLAAVRTAKKCLQTAQLEEGEKGDVCTINARARSEPRHVSDLPIETRELGLCSRWSAWSVQCKLKLACMLRKPIPRKPIPRKYSVIKMIEIPRKFCPLFMTFIHIEINLRHSKLL